MNWEHFLAVVDETLVKTGLLDKELYHEVVAICNGKNSPRFFAEHGRELEKMLHKVDMKTFQELVVIIKNLLRDEAIDADSCVKAVVSNFDGFGNTQDILKRLVWALFNSGLLDIRGHLALLLNDITSPDTMDIFEPLFTFLGENGYFTEEALMEIRDRIREMVCGKTNWTLCIDFFAKHYNDFERAQADPRIVDIYESMCKTTRDLFERSGCETNAKEMIRYGLRSANIGQCDPELVNRWVEIIYDLIFTRNALRDDKITERIRDSLKDAASLIHPSLRELIDQEDAGPSERDSAGPDAFTHKLVDQIGGLMEKTIEQMTRYSGVSPSTSSNPVIRMTENLYRAAQTRTNKHNITVRPIPRARPVPKLESVSQRPVVQRPASPVDSYDADFEAHVSRTSLEEAAEFMDGLSLTRAGRAFLESEGDMTERERRIVTRALAVYMTQN